VIESTYRADGLRVVGDDGTVVSAGYRTEKDAEQAAEKMNWNAKQTWARLNHPSDCYCDHPVQHAASLLETQRLEREMGMSFDD
jgi:ribosomal protein S5